MIKKTKQRRRLSHQILSAFALCFIISLILFILLSSVTSGLVEEYCFYNDIPLDEDMLFHLDFTVLGVSVVVSVLFFIILFFALLGEQFAYIKTITDGIDTLRQGNHDHRIAVKGNNDLTELAEAINYLSETEEQIKSKEKKLNEEKEELIRTLSHDIRTPLTSIISYTELLESKGDLTETEQREYISLVRKKTAQIKELTDILLDGGKRNVELFDDARLLFVQLAGELEEMLEDDFSVSADLSECPSFVGSFDTNEMRRIFDNLISNIRKYAEPLEVVKLRIIKDDGGISICQSNRVKNISETSESYRMGINSIRRIAQNYKGNVEIFSSETEFEIKITLSDF